MFKDIGNTLKFLARALYVTGCVIGALLGATALAALVVFVKGLLGWLLGIAALLAIFAMAFILSWIGACRVYAEGQRTDDINAQFVDEYFEHIIEQNDIIIRILAKQKGVSGYEPAAVMSPIKAEPTSIKVEPESERPATQTEEPAPTEEIEAETEESESTPEVIGEWMCPKCMRIVKDGTRCPCGYERV